MAFGDILTTEYWGVPLWGWILIILVLVGLIAAISRSMQKKSEDKKSEEAAAATDVETGLAKLPEGQPPKTPSPAQSFPRDAPLPPPAPSESSVKGN